MGAHSGPYRVKFGRLGVFGNLPPVGEFLALLRSDFETTQRAAPLPRCAIMASLIQEPNGRYRVQILGVDQKRRTIRIGRCARRTAEQIKGHIEAIYAAQLSQTDPSDATIRWIESIDASLHEKLVNAKLLTPRQTATLADFLQQLVASRTDAAPNTLKKWRTTQLLMIEFFGPDTPLESIDVARADEWRRALAEGRSENTIRKHVAEAKMFFNAAIRQGLIRANPFLGQSSTVMPNESRQHFVTRAEAQAVIDACPDAEWRLLFALARYGGLRIPSEAFAITWQDVDWSRQRFRVRSPKTHRKPDGGVRLIPIFPELKPYLEDAQEVAREGAVYVIERHRVSSGNLSTTMRRIIERAGLEPWPKLYQNLRSTRQTELEADFPLHVVCRWLGNSPKVANKHYLQVTDEHFARAVGEGGGGGALAGQGVAHPTQNPTQQAHARGRNALHAEQTDPAFPEKPEKSRVRENAPIAEEGLPQAAISREKPQRAARVAQNPTQQCAATATEVLAVDAEPHLALAVLARAIDPELAQVIARWPELPPSVRAAIGSLTNAWQAAHV